MFNMFIIYLNFQIDPGVSFSKFLLYFCFLSLFGLCSILTLFFFLTAFVVIFCCIYLFIRHSLLTSRGWKMWAHAQKRYQSYVHSNSPIIFSYYRWLKLSSVYFKIAKGAHISVSLLRFVSTMNALVRHTHVFCAIHFFIALFIVFLFFKKKRKNLYKRGRSALFSVLYSKLYYIHHSLFIDKIPFAVVVLVLWLNWHFMF